MAEQNRIEQDNTPWDGTVWVSVSGVGEWRCASGDYSLNSLLSIDWILFLNIFLFYE